MGKNKLAAMLAFIILAAALASMVSAENMTYVYRTGAGEIIRQNYTGSQTRINVTLPNTSWNIDLINRDGWLNISLAHINVTAYPELNITARNVSLTAQTYDTNGDMGRDSSFRYWPEYAYAFDIAQLTSEQYTVTFDYSQISGISSPAIFKCDFNFTTNLSNTSTCSKLSTSSSTSHVFGVASGFSAFFLADDTCTSRCGGPCEPCPAPGGGGGSGGGGGGSRGPAVVYVTPTPEGATVQVYQGDELIVVYSDSEYHYRLASVGDWKVSLKSLSDYATTDIMLGETKELRLGSIFGDKVKVSMHVSNRWAMLTFSTIETAKFDFPLLPARPRTPRTTGTPGTAGTTEPVTVITPTTTPSPAASAAIATPPEQIPVPESPIGIWTIIFAAVFVMFLVGGVALYRARLHRLEKPPTVTRTGLEQTGLPETSSTSSKPAPKILPQQKPAEPVAEEPEREYHLSKEKHMELEKYVYHAFSIGFNEDQVARALVEKGWPKGLVRKLLEEIRLKK